MKLGRSFRVSRLRVGLLPGGGPRRQHGFVERRVAFDEYRQTDVVEHRHQPGVGLADSQGAAGAVEPEVMGQQHADRLGVQVPHAFEVDDDMAGRRLVVKRVQVLAQQFDRLVVVELASSEA